VAKINYSFFLKKKLIQIIEPSENLKESYLKMSERFFESADLLLKNKFYESSTTDFYYSAYNSLLATLFYCGIKSENHNVSIGILKDILDKKELFEIISEIKEERIDKQYYHETPATKEKITEIKKLAREFNLQMRIFLNSLNKEKIKEIRKKLSSKTKKRFLFFL
jgi:uncharacterized protein (UPF0332 family)